MAKRFYVLPLDGQVVRLRLTIAGQRVLRERFDEEAIQTILLATTDAERMSALLDAALHWAGNDNPIQSGEALYDLLVDEGWSGTDCFSTLAFNIATQSGLITAEQAQLLKDSVHGAVDAAFRMSPESDSGESTTSDPFVES